MTKLLSEQELREHLLAFRGQSDKSIDEQAKDLRFMLDLIKSQKIAHGEMVIGSELLDIAEYTRMNRKAGHTSAMLLGAIRTQPIVLAADNMHREFLLSQGLSTVLIRGGSLRAYNRPLVVDHYALETMIFEQKGRNV